MSTPLDLLGPVMQDTMGQMTPMMLSTAHDAEPPANATLAQIEGNDAERLAARPMGQPSSPSDIERLLSRVTTPLLPPLLDTPATAPPQKKRASCSAATATRRSHRLLGRKIDITGGGNPSMCLARRLIISKRGLAIAEPGEEEEEEVLERYKLTFNKPLTDQQIQALQALAKTGTVKGGRRGRRT